MRIGIDCTSAGRQQAGIGRFTRGLVRGLMELDRKNDYLLVLAKDAPVLDWALPPNFSFRRLPFSEWALTVIWHRLRLPLPLDLLVKGLDVFHATDYLLPPLRRAAGLVTVHDLSFRLFPECAEPNLVRFLERALPASLARARLIFADSESTKNDIVRLYQQSPDRIVTVLGGIEEGFRPTTSDRIEVMRRQLSIEGPYILTLGTIEPRKNLNRLMEAYAVLKAEMGPLPRLLIGGGKGWLNELIYAKVDSLGLGESVRFLGFVPEASLTALLSGAELFVYPSLYEGFGFPPLEAMACGTPVVCSNTSSLPEVAGDAALLVNPIDVAAIAAAMKKVLKGPNLRAEMREQGRLQARQFTWHLSAETLLEAYESL